MSNYAVIKDGRNLVENIIVADDGFTIEGFNLIAIKDGEFCERGNFYNEKDGQFYTGQDFKIPAGTPEDD